MSLIPRPRKASKAIKRIKIMSRIVTNPEEHQSSDKFEISKREHGKSSERDEYKTSPSGLTSTTKYNHFFTHNPNSTNKQISNDTKFKFEDNIRIKVKEPSNVKNPSNF